MKRLTTTMMQWTLNKQDVRLTIGLDLGDRSSFYCVLDEAGDVLITGRPKSRARVFIRTSASLMLTARSRIASPPETGTS